ncbi:NAD(P)/FAD-dependent oxidoreductase [Chromohalobacter beijerinckii]|uniref:NAD(P)/FAD-dependent oxidoreductase n=1 Tax=Chromohalobacter beijerinckii TaxID=86179 RepID=A0ABV8XHI6_9GAMM|nr:FAD-dependent oxidoreductase [Chromohalobacter beijerinckii]MCK0764923.1 FAD-dependent oxidoreductase [Chromohalobacter beijerinckii]
MNRPHQPHTTSDLAASDSVDSTDIAIIGAGPAGAAAAAWLARRGWRVSVIERNHFPRFSIGESLLPQCMVHLDSCGLLDAARAGHFQPKNGAAFTYRGQDSAFDFRDKFSDGPGTTWQVERADFDQRLIAGAQAFGAQAEFGMQVTDFSGDADGQRLTLVDEQGDSRTLSARFVLDASGYGRVLARLNSLARQPSLESRCALFTHVEDRIADPRYDREKILIGLHPQDPNVWFWLIPFANGRASLGVVGERSRLERGGADDGERLWHFVRQEPRFAELLHDARSVRDVDRIEGYSASVETLHGPGYALLGNAGEFLDPVFSSGVTIALDSAMRAVPLVERQLQGENVDWQQDFEQPIRRGSATFRAFVEAWYDGRLPAIIFHHRQSARIRTMISAVLAGYAWDERNPYVSASERRLSRLAEVCPPLTSLSVEA